MHEMLLCSRWMVESTPKLDGRTYQHGQCSNIPVLQSVVVETIQQHVYVIDKSPGLQEQWIGPQFVWTMNDQQSEWSLVFLSAENTFQHIDDQNRKPSKCKW